MINAVVCHNCDKPNGFSLLCDDCRKTASRQKKNEVNKILREIAIGKTKVGDLYQCMHCEGLFTFEYMTLEHFPFTRGSRPDLKFDIRNIDGACTKCQVSNAKTRKTPTFEDMEPFLPVK